MNCIDLEFCVFDKNEVGFMSDYIHVPNLPMDGFIQIVVI